MLITGIILVILQVVVTLGAIMGGSNPFTGGIADLLGYFAIGIIGIILIIVAKRKNKQ